MQALTSTFAALVDRHESLRTAFRSSADGSAEQVITATGQFELTRVDLSEELADGREARMAQEARRIARTPFDLTQGPLLRVGLIQLSQEEHVLVVVMHHIIADGWSMQLIVEEFVELYRAAVEDREPRLTVLPIQYADYAAWQR